MDRERIQRRDFPLGRRGYDPATVDEHLRRVADDFEAHLQRPAPAMSAGASEQVRLILEAAERGAADMRAKAGEESAGHVARVQEAADGMLSRLDELQRELDGLLGALRSAGERLSSGLSELQRELAETRPGAAAEPEPAASAPTDLAALVDPGVPAEPPADPEPAFAGGEPGDDAGARLIALNMALSGSPRAETARYLHAHFSLDDVDALLDDVYAKAGR